MKKLMFMLAAVACAATMQAATYNWQWSTSDAATTAFETSPATLANTAIYLFFDQANTSSALANTSKGNTLTTLRTDGKTIADTGYYKSATLNDSGKLTAQSFTTDSAVKTYAYAVIIADGSDGSQWAYFSANKNTTGLETGSGTFGFSISSTATKALSETGTSAGWYQIKAASGGVPEPTSGLLLLVGAGMLALRRKQK